MFIFKTLAQSNDDSGIKNEVQSIKNLLLSRNQFPSVPTISPLLPSWQLESKSVIYCLKSISYTVNPFLVSQWQNIFSDADCYFLIVSFENLNEDYILNDNPLHNEAKYLF